MRNGFETSARRRQTKTIKQKVFTKEFKTAMRSAEAEVGHCKANSVVDVSQHVICAVDDLNESIKDKVSEGIRDHDH